MATYRLPLSRETAHGPFNRDRAPVLTIDPGDTVVFRTLDAGWGLGADRSGDKGRGFEVPPAEAEGHALCGPIAVRGARPGDALEIRIGEMIPHRYGWVWAGPRPWMEQWGLGVDREVQIGWEIDSEAMTASDLAGLGITLPLRPFMGVMGNAPAEPGPHSTRPPRIVGGNLDCRELVSGSVLWLPVEVEGALFSVGDGHAVQGDGELSSTAIECAMDHLALTFDVASGAGHKGPRAETPAGAIAFGIGDTLDEAGEMAASGMLDYLKERYGLERPEALAVASLAVHLRVTQVVNGTVGCHAVLPHGAFAISR